MEKRNYKEYKNFTENDFINDPYFQDWILNANTQNTRFWKVFFEKYPYKREAGEGAKIFLKNLVFKEDLPDESLVKRLLAKHLEDIKRSEYDSIVKINRRFQIKKLLGVAAIFTGILLVISALFLFNKKSGPVVIKTEYGNLKSVVLPDGSLVVLNANSTIRFDKKWDKNKSREVWLQGEAFFNVRHIPREGGHIQQNEKFIAHTEELTVEVLGTSFDIRQRRGKTEIVLQSGKIKVFFKDKRTKQIIMKPGDMLAFNVQKDTLLTTTTNAEDFSAWKIKKLILTDPTAAEIVEYLEDNFGKKIILENPELGKRKIEGPILLTNLNDALFVLSTVLNTKVIKKDSAIIMRSR